VDTSGAPISRASSWKLALVLFGLTLFTGICQVSGSVLALPLGTAFVPCGFALVAVLARLGDTELTARSLGLVLLVATVTALSLGSLALIVIHVVEPATLRESGRDVDFLPGGEARLSFMMGLLALCAAATMVGLFRSVRGAVKDIIPVDPDSFSHALGFSMAIAWALLPMLPLFVLGKPPLPLPAGLVPGESPSVVLPTFAERAAELAWFGVAALVIAGPGSRRTARAAVVRLGLTKPALWMPATALAVGVGLAWLQPYLSSTLTATLGLSAAQPGGWLPTRELSWGMAVGFSVLTAAGEELTYRGLLQPVLGLVLTNLILVSPMAWTDTWNVLFVAFGAGLVFGWLRSFGGTWTAFAAHVAFLLGARSLS
jgi:hypothetical protein